MSEKCNEKGLENECGMDFAEKYVSVEKEARPSLLFTKAQNVIGMSPQQALRLQAMVCFSFCLFIYLHIHRYTYRYIYGYHLHTHTRA